MRSPDHSFSAYLPIQYYMFLIGKGRRILNMYLFGAICFLPSYGYSLDRQLSSIEIDKLQANIKADPQNIKSRRFLILHYDKTKNWQELVNVAFPVQDKLSDSEILQLSHALIELKQDESALSTLKFFHDKNKPTSQSKYLEGLAITVSAGKEVDKKLKTELVNKAVDSFKASIKINPKQEDAYLGWIQLLEKFVNPHYDESLQIYRRMEEAMGELPRLYTDKCRLYYTGGYLDQAKEVCTMALDRYPKVVENLIYLGLTHEDLDNKEEAKKYYLIATKKFPDSFIAQKTIADFYFSQKNCLDSARHYSLAAHIKPKAAAPYLGLGECLYQLQQYDAALIAFRRNCYYSQKISTEFRSALGGLRSRPALHRKYENALASCKLRP